MTTRYALIAGSVLLLAAPGRVWSQTALDFDGTNDKVTVPGASALITGGTGITLTCWAYPTNAAPAFPDFDGFAGFRNENDADFYMLQVSPSNTLEARFRNSAGVAYTLEYSNLQLNAWQFLVFTYNGSQLTVYANGVNVATAPANGNITNGSGDLLIGDVLYQFTDFFLDGRVDEVSLWNRGLSQGEVNCIYANGVDLTADGLKLYYKMDEGVGGGNNAGISSLADCKGSINGALSGFALNGATSNFVTAPSVGNTISASFCPGDSYLFNGQQLTAPGFYGAAYDIGEICDSLVTLHLSHYAVNIQTSQVGGVLSSLAANGTWQWLDCNDGHAEIPGATGQSYTPTESGSYAVAVTQDGCTDTSACMAVIVAGIAGPAPALQARLFPDPATDQVRIDMGRTVHALSLVVNDVNGREVMRREIGTAGVVDVPVARLDAGLYFMHLRSAEGDGVYRLIKE